MRNRYATAAEPDRHRASSDMIPDYPDSKPARRLAKSKQRQDVWTQLVAFRNNLAKPPLYRPHEKAELGGIFQTLLQDYVGRVIDDTEVDFMASMGQAYHAAATMKEKNDEPTTTSVDLQKQNRRVMLAIVKFIEIWCRYRLQSQEGEKTNLLMQEMTLDHELRAFTRLADRPVECDASQASSEDAEKGNIQQELEGTVIANGDEAGAIEEVANTCPEQSVTRFEAVGAAAALPNRSTDSAVASPSTEVEVEEWGGGRSKKRSFDTSLNVVADHLDGHRATKALRVDDRSKEEEETWEEFVARASPKCFLSDTITSFCVTNEDLASRLHKPRTDTFLTNAHAFLDGIGYDTDDERDGKPCSIPAGTPALKVRAQTRKSLLSLAKEHGVVGGKWFFFVRHEDIHNVWKKVVDGVLTYRLGHKAEVSLVHRLQDDHVVKVYTADFDDSTELTRVFDMLSQLGFGQYCTRRRAYYKTVAFSLLNITSSTNEHNLKLYEQERVMQ